jgi:Calcineurin-like phosphoesterase
MPQPELHHFNNTPIPSRMTRHNEVGKVRREPGDPVAALKEMIRFEPIPRSAPQQLSVKFDVFDPRANETAIEAGNLVFHMVGDVGGIHGTATEEAIAAAMEDQLETNEGKRPAFLYIVGDVVYFNGQQRLYKTEFYEPYQYYRALIFAIPGNHDGDTHVRKDDQPDTEPSLYGFFENFCDTSPNQASPYRQSMTQPYPYWTLDAPFATIIGLYSNVEGSLDARGRSDQQAFLETQMSTASSDKKLIIAVHHPPYSLDSAHGGCPDILNALDRATVASKRVPDAVVSGHVHNYQRFSREVGNRRIPYIVAGAGGYADDRRSMHHLQKGLGSNTKPIKTKVKGVTLEKHNEEDPGFLRVTATKNRLVFEYFVVPFDGGTVSLFDSVTV